MAVCIDAAVLDFDLWEDSPEYDVVALLNQSRDAKHSGYGSHGHGNRYGTRALIGYHKKIQRLLAGYYRPYYRPTTTEKPKEEPLECGSGPFDGGPPLSCLLRTECIAQGGKLGVPCGRGFSRGICCECKSQV